MKRDRLKIGEKNILFFYYIYYIGIIQVKATVKDASGLALSNATVDIVIGGPETVTLTSNASDADGIAEAHCRPRSQTKGDKVELPLVLTRLRLPMLRLPGTIGMG